MNDCVYVILGGSGGIGSAVARRIAERGGKPVLAGRDADLLTATGMEHIVGDCTIPAQIDAVVAHALEKYGRLDGAVNCIGSILLKPAHMTTDAEWDETILRNLTTSFRLVRASVKAMTAGGSIVLVSSAAARIGLMNHEAIAAAKAGVIGLTLSAAASYAAKNIRVNCVAPGLVQTPLAARITGNEAALKASTAMHPLGRIGTAEDVAAAIAYFLDPQNAWVTGQVLGVDGGLGSVRSR